MTHSSNDKTKILIFGHKEFSQVMSSILSEYQDQATCRIVDAIVGTIDEASAHVSAFQPDLVISAGSNAAYLEQALDIPVLQVKVTEADIVSALQKAANIANNIHIISYDEHTKLVALLNENTELNISAHTYTTAEEARNLFHMMKLDDNDVVVGASLVCGLATHSGKKSVLMYSQSSCREAIQRAIRIVSKNKQNQHEQAVRQWLIRDAKTPIIVLNAQTQRVSYNNAAQHRLGIESNDDFLLSSMREGTYSKGEDTYCSANGQRWRVHKDTQMINRIAFDIYHLYSSDEALSKNAKPKAATTTNMDSFAFQSSVMKKLVEQISIYSQSPSPVLIYGESGTGKEAVAKQLHHKGEFADGNFVAVNCAAIPSELFEGELFGYVDGAFTGSRKGGKRGLLFEANGGALFLDEIAELTELQQAKLLRVLQEKHYRPIGSQKEYKVDTKIIAASNKSLEGLVHTGDFRDDLFYRLNVLSINVPALRDRKEDIGLIANMKLSQFNFANVSDSSLKEILGEILSALENFYWPGNIRQLENIVERMMVYFSSDPAKYKHKCLSLLHKLAPELFLQNPAELTGALETNEHFLLQQAMSKFNGNKEKTAAYLGISQTTLWRRLKRIQHENNDNEGKHHA